jgi:hypothetical protein
MSVDTIHQAMFDTSHRCDRCGAQAKRMVELESGLDLLFCNHHFTEAGDKLIGMAVKIHAE